MKRMPKQEIARLIQRVAANQTPSLNNRETVEMSLVDQYGADRSEWPVKCSPTFVSNTMAKARKLKAEQRKAASVSTPEREAPAVLHFCPQCGFNLQLYQVSYQIAAKHSNKS